jgi:predicted dehydrogenase
MNAASQRTTTLMSDRELRVVLAGCGAMSEAWLRAAREMGGLRMVGFVDLREEAARAKADVYGDAASVTGASIQAVLEQMHPDIVFDCTVPEAHYEVTLAALNHGAHVLGEKPLADTLDHAREMVSAAAQAGKLYAVIQNRRYDPNIRRVQSLLVSGAIGQLHTLHSDFFLGPHFGGFRDEMRHPLLLDMSVHTLDAARYLSGADPVAVICHAWNPRGSWYAHGASAVAIFEMSDGVIYTYRASWCAEGLATSWEGDWRLIGTNGTALWDGAGDLRAQRPARREGFISPVEDVPIPEAVEGRTGGHAGIMREFVDCVRGGGTPETIASDNIKSLAMVLAAIESADTGRRVEVRW